MASTGKAESKNGESKDGGGAKEVSWEQINFNEVELGKKIGGGGVGLIYEGTFRGEPVAVKTLFDPKVDQALMQEYLDECLVMSGLDHPNVVAFKGASLTPPNLCFVMELCDSTLYDLLHRQQTRFTTYERLQVAVDVASAFRYLHFDCPRAPLVHRDLKSLNLLVRRGVVKLCDFGLVRTKTTQAGTPAYMAPELLAGGAFSKAVDVYAFGVLLWEVFAQEIPFAGYALDELRRAVGRGDRPRMPSADTPPEVRGLINRCWAQAPADRPDFLEIHDTVTALLDRTPQRSELESMESAGGGDALDDLMGFGGK